MCTDTTRQEIAFLISILRSAEPRSRLELARDLPKELTSLQWPSYLADEPRSVDELLNDAIDLKTVSKVAPFSWVASDIGRDRLLDLIDRFLPAAERQKLRDASGIFA